MVQMKIEGSVRTHGQTDQKMVLVTSNLSTTKGRTIKWLKNVFLTAFLTLNPTSLMVTMVVEGRHKVSLLCVPF